MRNRPTILISAFVMLLLIGTAGGVDWPGRFGAELDAADVTVMTFNVGDALPRTFPVAATADCILKQGRPDVLFLQEAPSGRTWTKLQERLGYPHVLRADTHRGKIGRLRVLTTFPITASQEIPLPSDGKGAGALCAILDVHGVAVQACSVHLDEITPKPRASDGQIHLSATETISVLQTELVRQTSRSRAVATLIHRLPSDTGLPTLIGGDFNTIPGSRTIRDMDAQFRDVLWPTAGYLAGTYHKIRFPIRPRVDYLFVSDQLSADRASVVRESAGDHYPVSAALRIKQTEASAFAFDTAIKGSGS